MANRKIIEIDQEKCDGCGQCVTACAEGAIEIRDGKARLVAETYCDGLGACLGTCPRDAIRIVEREAAVFNEASVHEHLADLGKRSGVAMPSGHCPGAGVRSLPQLPQVEPPLGAGAARPGDEPSDASALGNWPIQLKLVPPNAPFLRGADLLLVADCVPFAMADFHRQLLRGRPVVIGCPKLDDGQAYVEKLTAILAVSEVRSVTIVHMEVPCCKGLVRIAAAAMQHSGRKTPLREVTISVHGQILRSESLAVEA